MSESLSAKMRSESKSNSEGESREQPERKPPLFMVLLWICYEVRADLRTSREPAY